jgi:hypothetical protein
MRRVSWPDEPGWWWKVSSHERAIPIEFIRRCYTDGRTEFVRQGGFVDSGEGVSYEGPIPEPKTLMRFEVTGSIVSAVVECYQNAWLKDAAKATLTIDVSRGDIPFEDARYKKFRITFEEIL